MPTVLAIILRTSCKTDAIIVIQVPARHISSLFFPWRHNPKEARKPLNGCCAGLPGKAVADAPHAAGIDVAVFPNAKTHLVLDPRKDQVVGCCVVAAALAGFHRFMVEVLGQRDQAAGVGVPELGSVVDKGKDVVEVR